jgi:hypothetical protein
MIDVALQRLVVSAKLSIKINVVGKAVSTILRALQLCRREEKHKGCLTDAVRLYFCPAMHPYMYACTQMFLFIYSLKSFGF